MSYLVDLLYDASKEIRSMSDACLDLITVYFY